MAFEKKLFIFVDLDEPLVLREIKLAGFLDATKAGDDVWQNYNCRKPNISVGATVPLKLPQSIAKPKVWNISANDEDLIDEDALLEEEDYLKPAPASLKGDFLQNFFFLECFLLNSE
ncbi:unnamed protein product [Gongylonema pulchrum]|uniref:Uncharacterized protein n=1 Tax=Gongylonema pulchrum TaxID=637853 RepID=A0A183F166_9BILA|nr:unnamed protein product [Gongylonema pulchrum]